MILNGWPDNVNGTPGVLKPYYCIRGDFSVQNGLILKSDRVYSPENEVIYFRMYTFITYGYRKLLEKSQGMFVLALNDCRCKTVCFKM